MAADKISEMTLEELIAKEKTLKKTIPLFSGIILFLIAVGIYLTVKQGFNVFTVLPVVFVGLVIAGISKLKNIQKEISIRDNKKL